MTVDALIRALGLPESTRLDQRVPKKLLAEQDVATPADRRQIQEGVDEIVWLAALKPHLIGVPAHEDAQRQYLELAVLHLTLKPGAKPGRLVELLHRAVPYPVLLLLDAPHGLSVSAAHKRWAHNEEGKVVLDGDVLAAALTGAAPGVHSDFLHAIALQRQPQAHLLALYEGWMACLLALQVAHHTGQFLCQNGLQPLPDKRKQLQKYEQLLADAARLRSQAGKAKQMAQQVELNLALQRVQAQLAEARSQLSPKPHTEE